MLWGFFCSRHGLGIDNHLSPIKRELRQNRSHIKLPLILPFHYHGKMKRRLIWLVTASLVSASPHVFSVTDDLLAYPQVSHPATSRVPASR